MKQPPGYLSVYLFIFSVYLSAGLSVCLPKSAIKINLNIIFKWMWKIKHYFKLVLRYILLICKYCFNNLISGVSGETTETELMNETIKWNDWGLHIISRAVKKQPLINIFCFLVRTQIKFHIWRACYELNLHKPFFLWGMHRDVGWVICWLQHNDIWRKWPRLWAENKHEVKKHAWQISC